MLLSPEAQMLWEVQLAILLDLTRPMMLETRTELTFT